MAVSINSFPLNILNTLGIKVKASEDQGPHLSESLAKYLDEIIKDGDRNSLYEVANQVLDEAKNIAATHPRVTMNALLAFVDSLNGEINELGKNVFSTDGKTNQAILRYQKSNKSFYEEITKSVGIGDIGLGLGIVDITKFNTFLESLDNTNCELTEKDKEVLLEIIEHELSIIAQELHAEIDKKNNNTIAEKVRLLENFSEKLGFTEIGNVHGQMIDLKSVQRALNTIELGLMFNRPQDMKNFADSLIQYLTRE